MHHSPHNTRAAPSTTLVLTQAGGRFANQLMVFGHLIALAEEHPELRILNMSFWRFADLCAGTDWNRLCVYPKPTSRPRAEKIPQTLQQLSRFIPEFVSRTIRHLGPPLLHKIVPGQSVVLPDLDPWDLGSEPFLSQIRGHKRVMLTGWRLRDWALFAKHQDPVREFLKPAPRFYDIANPFIAKLREKHHPLIGLLIRQTDYRKWEDGKFFMSTERYRSCLEKLRDRLGPAAGFVLGADEPQPPNAFDGLPFYWATGAAGQTGHYLETFAELSLCDYVVSVPSTFSSWAAFFGRKPLLAIDPSDDNWISASPFHDSLLDAHKDPLFSAAVN
jgi:hypothetical protein